MTDVIVAQCTPRGSGAIALIRLSGEGVCQLLAPSAQLSKKHTLCAMESHTVSHGLFVHPHTKKVIDEVLFIYMKSPHSFTGEDVVEITCHNNQFIIDEIISSSLQLGARLALPGEFSKRAVLSGKIDVLQAEAIAEVVSAQQSFAVAAGMAQLKGSLSSFIKELEKFLLDALIFCEATFEFLEEEQRDIGMGSVLEDKVKQILEKVDFLIHAKEKGKFACRKIKISLCGSVNAGKSTLFNSLLGYERSITSPYEGTTRDFIEASMFLGQKEVCLVDTAGYRKASCAIEKEGIERALQEIGQSDVIILVIDTSVPLQEEEKNFYESIFATILGGCFVIAATKKEAQLPSAVSDIKEFLAKHNIKINFISCHKNEGITELVEEIEKAAAKQIESEASPFLINERHAFVIKSMQQHMGEIMSEKLWQNSPELLAFHLKKMLELTGEFSGREIQGKAFDEIFKGFCVGK